MMCSAQLTRTVDRDLVNIGRLQSVHLRIPVKERSPLEQRIGRELDTRDERSGGESGLFDVSVVIFRVSVELDFSNFVHRELTLT